jgi:anhydro-N-acetylmuramic acid kinase
MSAHLPHSASSLYIGLMSGTSMDGVDAVLVDFSQQKWRLAHTESAEFAPELRAELLALNTAGDNELHRAQLAGNALARVYAQAVHALLAKAQLKPADIRALGAHGQTVRHRPQMFDVTQGSGGYTLQLNNPALLAELTGIDVVCDFRSRDVAAGGQGAPLAPFFHHAWLGSAPGTATSTRGVLNLGGISNLTILQADGGTLGFDCGPGNALLDLWCQEHTGAAFDRDGAWGAGGTVHEALLASMMREPYFQLPWPKSTGRDLFNRAWLAQHLQGITASPQDVQKTLVELTVGPIRMCVTSYQNHSTQSLQEIVVCGGGAHNLDLMRSLQRAVSPIRVVSSAERGIAPQDVEAAAFAWLARACVERRALPLASVTGARGARVLGAIYPR